MKNILLDAVRKHAEGHIAKHKANVEVYLNSVTGIGEHPDIIQAIEDELKQIGHYHEQLEVLDAYFSSKDQING
jgi:hypothetical protein